MKVSTDAENRKKSKIPVKTAKSFQSLTKVGGGDDQNKSITLPEVDGPPAEADDHKKDIQLGLEEPLPDFNKVQQIHAQAFDGAFELDDDDMDDFGDDSDGYIEKKVAEITGTNSNN